MDKITALRRSESSTHTLRFGLPFSTSSTGQTCSGLRRSLSAWLSFLFNGRARSNKNCSFNQTRTFVLNEQFLFELALSSAPRASWFVKRGTTKSVHLAIRMTPSLRLNPRTLAAGRKLGLHPKTRGTLFQILPYSCAGARSLPAESAPVLLTPLYPPSSGKISKAAAKVEASSTKQKFRRHRNLF